MTPISVVAIFCEDIREEKTGQDTIIGILPDSINVARVPGVMPKMGLYLRLHFMPDAKPKNVTARLVNTDGSSIPFQGWQTELIEKSFSDSEQSKMPVVGLIMKLVAAPFPIQSVGKLVAIVTVDGQEFTAGALNVTAVAPTVSSLPASQSPTAAS